MAYHSCIAKRTRSQSDLYLENLFRRSRGIEDQPKEVKSSQYRPKKGEGAFGYGVSQKPNLGKRKIRRVGSKASDSEVVFLGMTDGEGREVDRDRDEQRDSVLVGSKSNLDKGKGVWGGEDDPFEVIEIDGSDGDKDPDFECVEDESFCMKVKSSVEPKLDFHEVISNGSDEDEDKSVGHEPGENGLDMDCESSQGVSRSSNQLKMGFENKDKQISDKDSEFDSEEVSSSSDSDEADDSDDDDFQVDKSEPSDSTEGESSSCDEDSEGETSDGDKEEVSIDSETEKRVKVGKEMKKKSNQGSEKEEDKTNDSKKGDCEEKKSDKKEFQFWSKKKRAGIPKDFDVFKLLVKSIWEKGDVLNDDLVASEEETCEQNTDSPVVEEPLPLKFTFGIEEPEPVEKSEFDKELDKLWEEMEFVLKSTEIGSFTSPVVDSEGINASEAKTNTVTSCLQGKHELILDEEIGIRCLYCSLVDVEIRYVSPPMEKYPLENLGRKSSSPEDDMPMFDGHQFHTSGSNSQDPCSHTKGTVWDLIPDIRKSMYPHQQEGFEFIWKNLAGTIYLDKLKSSDTNDVGGCIISHAPGTGKTRLTIVFLQTYLELFPKCRPVIIAPASLLLTWEEEFRKWNIGIPFHNLNNLEFSGKENMAAVDILEGNRHQSRSKNSIRMVKLFSWSKNKSILGVSYNLYEKLAGEKIVLDKVTKKKRKAMLDRESEDLRKVLLECPGLLVLDEGHTPRNQRSRIWKVLSKVLTERRIILSGTPFQNNFGELYNTLCLVRPAFADLIPSRLKKFCQKRWMPEKGSQREKQAFLSSPVDKLADDGIAELRALMAPFVHVHKGNILQKHLPGLRDCIVVLNPTDLQKQLLESVQVSQNTFEFEHRLSMVSVHPSLFLRCCVSKEEESVINWDLLEGLKLNPREGVKTRFLIEFIRLSEAINEKVLVFSQYIDPLCLIIDQLSSLFKWSEGKEVLYMHGKLEQKQRQSLINMFNDPNSQAKILLASTKACSEGINLVGASRVVLLDVVWNPSVERQAISRAYRLGQKRVVYTYHLITQGTTECDKYCKQAKKDRISELVFSSLNKENDKQKKSAVVSEDKILDEMVWHDKLKDMFEKIIYQPKESDLVESFGNVALPREELDKPG